MMSKKPFSKTTFGKALWWIGDTAKGKTKIGKGLDSALEVLPVPNPIRFARELDHQEKLKELKQHSTIRHAANAAGVDLDDMIDDGPKWMRPALAFIALIGLLVLVGMGIIEPQILIEGLRAIFANQ